MGKGTNAETGKLILMHISDAQYLLEDGEWTVSDIKYDDEKSTVELNVPLRGTPMLWAHLIHKELILPECLEDKEGNCVIRGIAAFMELPVKQVEFST